VLRHHCNVLIRDREDLNLERPDRLIVQQIWSVMPSRWYALRTDGSAAGFALRLCESGHDAAGRPEADRHRAE
jgi:hypothetical protein